MNLMEQPQSRRDTESVDFRRYYDLETYLFSIVNQRFHEQGWLSALDFFCIIVWKANRAKTKIRRRLLSKGHENLEDAVRDLTSSLAAQPDAANRLQFLLSDWGFRLPMASAILTILWPTDFTVYDYRICDELKDFGNLAEIGNFDRLWKNYQSYCQAVAEAAPEGMSLRDCDRWLWGRSAYKDLLSLVNDVRHT